MAIKGKAQVLRKAKAEMSKKVKASRSTMQRAVLLIRRKSMAITPVGDTGNLRASHTTDVFERGGEVVGEIRVTASYAIYVHEMPETYNFRRPGSGPKFLEKALFENQQKVIEILSSLKR